MKGETPSFLDDTVPKITEGFITSRINSVQVLLYTRYAITIIALQKKRTFATLIVCYFYPSQAILADNSLENPLDNVEVLQDQLEFLPYLSRFKVAVTSQFFITELNDFLFQTFKRY
jgi:exportin-7